MKKKLSACILALAFCLGMNAQKQEPIVIHLWPQGAPESNGLSGPEEIVAGDRVRNVSDPTITVYPAAKPNGQAIIVCPGGGYVRLAPNHEGHDMAQWLNGQGITLAVLKYRMPNGHHAIPLSDAQQAMRILKQHAQQWGIKTIGIMGASAGGHLASTLATHFTDDTRPDFQILFYPMISYLKFGKIIKENPLLGNQPSEELIKLYSNELQVTEQTPPAFIMMSSDDHTVSIDDCLAYYQALLRNHVQATIHIYPTGGHGWGYLEGFAYKRQWTEELEKWLRELNRTKE